MFGLLHDGELDRTLDYYHDLRMNTVYYRPGKRPALREPRERREPREPRERPVRPRTGPGRSAPVALCRISGMLLYGGVWKRNR